MEKIISQLNVSNNSNTYKKIKSYLNIIIGKGIAGTVYKLSKTTDIAVKVQKNKFNNVYVRRINKKKYVKYFIHSVIISIIHHMYLSSIYDGIKCNQIIYHCINFVKYYNHFIYVKDDKIRSYLFIELLENKFESEICSNIYELESFTVQVLLTLLISQNEFQFTHNDLHKNNIMYIDKSKITYRGKQISDCLLYNVFGFEIYIKSKYIFKLTDLDVSCKFHGNNDKEEYISDKLYNYKRESKTTKFLPSFDILFYLSLIPLSVYEKSKFLTELIVQITNHIFKNLIPEDQILNLIIKRGIFYNKDGANRPFFYVSMFDVSSIILKCIYKYFNTKFHNNVTEICYYPFQVKDLKYTSENYVKKMDIQRKLILKNIYKYI